MQNTSCGNLPQMLRSSRAAAVAVCVALGWGCTRDAEAPHIQQRPNPPAAPSPRTDETFAEQVKSWSTQLQASPDLPTTSAFESARTQLLRAANEAQDLHLRANAAILLGSMFELRQDVDAAIAQYTLASKLVPDDAGPWMVLALAHASKRQFRQAAQAQLQAAKLDPDNLDNWLRLGEMRVKGDDEKGATEAYATYELRRKQLIDALTLRSDSGEYIADAQTRIHSAEALASATDSGTAVALVYAIKSESDSSVRAAIANVMGLQRLESYRPVLESVKRSTPKGPVRDAVGAALEEIARDPLRPTQAPAPTAQAASGQTGSTQPTSEQP